MNPRHGAVLALLGLGATLCGCAGAANDSATKPPDISRVSVLAVTSEAFTAGSRIPAEYGTQRAGGRNMSIPLSWTGAPDSTRSFAIEVVDMSPAANMWVHWLVADIPASVSDLPGGASGTSMPNGARELDNTFGEPGWGGPQPPSGIHEYRATVYALDVPQLDLADDSSLDEFRSAIEGHVLASGSITGMYAH